MFVGTLALFCNTSSLVAYCMQTCCIFLYLRCLSLWKMFRKIFLSLISSQHVFAHCVFYANVLHSRRFEIVKIVFVLFNHSYCDCEFHCLYSVPTSTALREAVLVSAIPPTAHPTPNERMCQRSSLAQWTTTGKRARVHRDYWRLARVSCRVSHHNR